MSNTVREVNTEDSVRRCLGELNVDVSRVSGSIRGYLNDIETITVSIAEQIDEATSNIQDARRQLVSISEGLNTAIERVAGIYAGEVTVDNSWQVRLGDPYLVGGDVVTDIVVKCSSCDCEFKFARDSISSDDANNVLFCPHCGVNMTESLRESVTEYLRSFSHVDAYSRVEVQATSATIDGAELLRRAGVTVDSEVATSEDGAVAQRATKMEAVGVDGEHIYFCPNCGKRIDANTVQCSCGLRFA